MSDTPEQPWSAMTPVEQYIRSHLYHPTDRKRRGEEALPKHIRRKEWRDAANWTDTLREAENEIKMWQDLLDLYLQERAEIGEVGRKFLEDQ